MMACVVIRALVSTALTFGLVAAGALAASESQPLNPGDTFDLSCNTSIVNVQISGGHISGACATPVPSPISVPNAANAVWVRPKLTPLGKSEGYIDHAFRYGSGTEPLDALEQCGYIAQGGDDDHVFWVGHPPAPLTIYAIRFHTWQGTPDQEGIPMSEQFWFTDTADAAKPSNENPDPPDIAATPFLSLSIPVPFMTDFIVQRTLTPPVTINNLRIDGLSFQSWVTIGDLEILTEAGIAGQAAC
jgi:hypothetical protein